MMKCVCGYEKIGEQFVDIPESYEYYAYGAKKGKVKRIIPACKEYKDVDPDKDEFIEIHIEKGFNFFYKTSNWGGTTNVLIYACPKCGTLKIGGLD